jgi:hypothetical protein
LASLASFSEVRTFSYAASQSSLRQDRNLLISLNAVQALSTLFHACRFGFQPEVWR